METLHVLQSRESEPKGISVLVGFDADGTLFREPQRSHPQVFGAIVTQVFGIPQDQAVAFAQSTAGMPTGQQLIGILERHFSLSLPQGVLRFIAYRIDKEFFDQNVELFPEVLSMLHELKTQGIPFFISSMRPQESLERIISENPELAEIIPLALGTNSQNPDFKKGKSHFVSAMQFFGIFPRIKVHVGDTPSDVGLIKDGMITIGRTGAYTKGRLEEAGASFVVDDLSVLPIALELITRSLNAYD